MTRPRLPLYLLALFASTLFFTPTAQAQGVLRFVATFGSDANNCLRPTPCRSLNRGVQSAPDGAEVIILDSGGYGPSVTITKSITITAPAAVQATVATPSGNAITVNAPGATVVLRGLTLMGLGAEDGIDATSFGTLHVESCVISGFADRGVWVNLSAGGSEVFIKDTISRNNTWQGFAFTTTTGTVKVSIDNCRAEGNANGAGFLIMQHAEASISDSVAAGNNVGFSASDGTATVSDSTASGNASIGFAAGINGRLRVTRSTSANNVDGFSVSSGQLTVSHSTSSDNNGHGFAADNAGRMVIDNCVATGNTISGISASGTGTIVRVSNTTATNNNYGFRQATGSTFYTRQNNTVHGNTTDVEAAVPLSPLSGT